MAEEGFRELMRAALAALLLGLALTSAISAPKEKEKGPVWASLTADQQQALAPLSGEWGKLARDQKTKWLGIAKRYPAMNPEEQKRVQGRMQLWTKLTPAQRSEAREQYRSIGKAAPSRREELHRYWAEYQALPPHEKRMFDVPPSYVPPAKRRERKPATTGKSEPAHAAPM